ncbi:restriction endonuclease [Niallia taxi]|uniref:restriction endonuclease n=1 Tax=Niallia taxi TaxID=2499688 RepID=UPI002934D982|nr:restriction endonuclease [Niallia taxi]WOD61742.1 restriction endonuclease [Niallia taxi]
MKKVEYTSYSSYLTTLKNEKCKICSKYIFYIEGEKEISKIDQMSGIEFEIFLQTLFMNLGYQVVRTNSSGDQGADLIINKNGKRIAVQAKRYKNKKVGNKAVQEVLSGKYYYNCDEAWVVTNSNFTDSAYNLSIKTNVELISRLNLMELMLKSADK